MADTKLIYRVRQMETIYLNYVAHPNEQSYLKLYHYFINHWADDRDYIFAETNDSYAIFKPSKLASLFEQEPRILMMS